MTGIEIGKIHGKQNMSRVTFLLFEFVYLF